MLIDRKLNLKKYINFLNLLEIWPMSILLISILLTNNYQSEFKNLPVLLSKIEILIYFFIILFGYIFLKKIFFLSLKIRLIPKNFSTIICFDIWDRFFLVILVLQYIFFLKTGVGKLFSNNTSPYSFIFNLFSLRQFFIYYYFFCYRKNKLFYINILGLVLLEILKGWSGIIFQIFLYEMYFYLKNNKFAKIKYYYPLILLIGAKIYEKMYVIKNQIRLGIKLTINYKEALIKLIERLTYFPHALVGIQNQNKILFLYKEYNIDFLEIKSFFKPIIPGFIMKNKDFRGVNNLLMKSVYEDLGNQTSSNMGIVTLFVNLIKFGFIEYGSFLIMGCLVLLLVKFFSDLLGKNESKNESDIIFYFYLLSLYIKGSLEMSFYGYIPIVVLFLVLFLFKGIKLRKVKDKC